MILVIGLNKGTEIVQRILKGKIESQRPCQYIFIHDGKRERKTFHASVCPIDSSTGENKRLFFFYKAMTNTIFDNYWRMITPTT